MMTERTGPRDDPAGWLVYRCSGSETGSLEDRLGELGHKVWAPRAWVSKRVPRKRVRRVVLLAMLPSYLFVSKHADLEALASLGAKFGFWGPMAIRGVRVELKDRDLDGLRAADDRVSAPKKWVDPPDPLTQENSVVEKASSTDRLSGAMVAPKARSDRHGARSDRPGVQSGSTEEQTRASTKHYEHLKGSSVLVSSGPLAQLGLIALLEEIDGDRACISAFGGRVWMDLAHLTVKGD